MNILKKIRALPQGTMSRVISLAHDIANNKNAEVYGWGAQYASNSILFYDKDTWERAYNAVAVPELEAAKKRDGYV